MKTTAEPAAHAPPAVHPQRATTTAAIHLLAVLVRRRLMAVPWCVMGPNIFPVSSGEYKNRGRRRRRGANGKT
jgi:hypothetical protein